MTALLFIHRWLGIAGGALFALWFASGIAMIYVRMPEVTPAERLARTAPLDPSLVHVGLDAAAQAAAAAPAAAVRLRMLGPRPVYVFGATGPSVFADDGSLLAPVGGDAALALGRAFLGSGRRRARLRRARDHARPVDTAAAPAPAAPPPRRRGRRRHDALRVERHRRGRDANHPAVAVARLPRADSALALSAGAAPQRRAVVAGRDRGVGCWAAWRVCRGWASASGGCRSAVAIAAMAGRRCRPMPAGCAGITTPVWPSASSPSPGPSAACCRWIRFRSCPPEAPRAAQRRAVRGPRRRPAVLDAATVVSGRAGGRGEARPQGDGADSRRRTAVLDRRRERRSAACWSRPIDPTDGAFERFPAAEVEALGRAAAPSPIADGRVARRRRRLLPKQRRAAAPAGAPRASPTDADGTWLYLDPRTGSIVQVLRRPDRVNRWLYHGLHSLDPIWLRTRRPLWDADRDRPQRSAAWRSPRPAPCPAGGGFAAP